MKNPYEEKLLSLEGQEAVIHRAGASELKGKVAEVGEGGCEIKLLSSTSESVMVVFVAYKDIRGGRSRRLGSRNINTKRKRFQRQLFLSKSGHHRNSVWCPLIFLQKKTLPEMLAPLFPPGRDTSGSDKG